jgi:hypothetical protein
MTYVRCSLSTASHMFPYHFILCSVIMSMNRRLVLLLQLTLCLIIIAHSLSCCLYAIYDVFHLFLY